MNRNIIVKGILGFIALFLIVGLFIFSFLAVFTYDCRLTVEENDNKYYNEVILLDTAEYNLITVLKDYPELAKIHSDQCIELKQHGQLDIAAKRLNISEEELYNYLRDNLIFPYHFYLIFWNESSYRLEDKGTYIGLGQINTNFIKSCGYTLRQYNRDWKVQVKVAHYYFLTYMPENNPQLIENIYAKWLSSSWNGREDIYTLKRNPVEYKANKGLDKNKDNKISVSDLKIIFTNIKKRK